MNRFEARRKIKEDTTGFKSSQEIKDYTQKFLDDHADLPTLIAFKVVASELNADYGTNLSAGEVKQIFQDETAWNEATLETQPIDTEIASDKSYVGIENEEIEDSKEDYTSEWDEDIEDEDTGYLDIDFEDDYDEWPDEDELEESIKLLKAKGYKIAEASYPSDPSVVSGKYMRNGMQFGTDAEIEKAMYDDFAASELKKVRPKHSSYDDEIANLKFEEAKKVLIKAGYKLEESKKKNLIETKTDDKKDYPKRDIYVDGKYVSSTTWAKTNQDAVDGWIEKNPKDKDKKVIVKRVKESVLKESTFDWSDISLELKEIFDVANFDQTLDKMNIYFDTSWASGKGIKTVCFKRPEISIYVIYERNTIAFELYKSVWGDSKKVHSSTPVHINDKLVDKTISFLETVQDLYNSMREYFEKGADYDTKNSKFLEDSIRGPRRRIVKQDDTYTKVYSEIEDLTQITKNLTYLSAAEASAEMYHTTPEYAMNIAKDVANDYLDDEAWKIQNNKYKRKYPIITEE
jgi:hypothetical protein